MSVENPHVSTAADVQAEPPPKPQWLVDAGAELGWNFPNSLLGCVLAIVIERGRVCAPELWRSLLERGGPKGLKLRDVKGELALMEHQGLLLSDLDLAFPGDKRERVYRLVRDARELGVGGHVVRYKGADWPVTDRWARAHLSGGFADLVSWETGVQNADVAFDPERPALWARLWALLRKSDETLAQRTAGLSHAEVRALMLDPKVQKKILETLSRAEVRELRAAEAHIIVRNCVDFLLGRDLAEVGVDYIDHVHGQGAIPGCGCDLLWVKNDWKLARIHAGEPGLECASAHFPRKLCGRHAHLQAIVFGAGRWHNQPLAQRLDGLREAVYSDQPEQETEAQPEAAAAA